MAYDSTPDTNKHIDEVRKRIYQVQQELEQRYYRHDASKLEEPELSVFNEYTPKLRDTTYGSDDYNRYLKEMGKGLQHHYEVNDHHPEHFPNGIHDMNLVQLIEMLCDWKAATLRHKDGNLRTSIIENSERFDYDELMTDLLLRTADYFGWI
jgi:hypothetical protein